MCAIHSAPLGARVALIAGGIGDEVPAELRLAKRGRASLEPLDVGQLVVHAPERH